MSPDAQRASDVPTDISVADSDLNRAESAASSATTGEASIAPTDAQQSSQGAHPSPIQGDDGAASYSAAATGPKVNLLESLAVQPTVAAPVSAQQVELKLDIGQSTLALTTAAAQLSQLVAAGAAGAGHVANPSIDTVAADQHAGAINPVQVASVAGVTPAIAINSNQIDKSVAGVGQHTDTPIQAVTSSAVANAGALQSLHKPTQRSNAIEQAAALKSNGVHSAIVTDAVRSPDDAVVPTNPAVARAEQLNTAVRIDNAASMDASIQSASMAAKHALPPFVDAGPNIFAVQARDAGTLPSWMNASAASEDDQFSAQVSRGMTAMMNQRGGVMNMRLTPPELGELRVQMTLSRGVVTAEFQASTAQAHALLERGMMTLRAALESQGLTVDRLTVHGMTHAAGQSSLRDETSGQGSSSQGSSHDRNSHDAAGGESRGRHEYAQNGAERRCGRADFAGLFDDLNADSFLNEVAAARTGS